MSTDDIDPTTLTDFGLRSRDLEDVPDREVEQPFQTAGATPRRCQNCGAHVSREWQRVKGDNQDRVWGCRECGKQRCTTDTGGGNDGPPDG